MAFVAPVPVAIGRNAATTSYRPARRPHVRMATISRPDPAALAAPIAEEKDVRTQADVVAPELAAVAATVCEFMNTERLRDLASYIVRFGSKFDDLGQLTDVRMTGLDALGFTADVVSCDDTSHCVCVQERLDWPLGLCHSAGDVITALKYLSTACGLPADF